MEKNVTEYGYAFSHLLQQEINSFTKPDMPNLHNKISLQLTDETAHTHCLYIFQQARNTSQALVTALQCHKLRHYHPNTHQ